MADLKAGDGTLTWPDGRQYSGGWRAGKQHGQGTFTNADGMSRDGVWEDGRLVRWRTEWQKKTSETIKPPLDADLERVVAI